MNAIKLLLLSQFRGIAAQVLRAQIVKFIKRAEEKGWLFDIDLPEEKIADIICAIISGEELVGKDKPLASKVIPAIIRREIYNDANAVTNH